MEKHNAFITTPNVLLSRTLSMKQLNIGLSLFPPVSPSLFNVTLVQMCKTRFESPTSYKDIRLHISTSLGCYHRLLESSGEYIKTHQVCSSTS